MLERPGDHLQGASEPGGEVDGVPGALRRSGAVLDELVHRKKIALDHASYLEDQYTEGVGRRELEIAAFLREVR